MGNGVENTLSPTEVIDRFLAEYGHQHWWPGDSFFEIIVGAILTQNTNWINVSRAISLLAEESLLEPRAMWLASAEDVKKCIVPAGYYNVKYQRLRSFLAYLVEKRLDFHLFFRQNVESLREELLKIKGIGPETADSILLYAFNRPVFVVDAYTRRLFSRLGYGWMKESSYMDVQSFFIQQLPQSAPYYNEAHALIVAHSKKVCKKRPRCDVCLLREVCPESILITEEKNEIPHQDGQALKEVSISNLR